MSRWVMIVIVALIGGSLVMAGHEEGTFFARLRVGDGVFPYIRFWNGEDRANERLYVSSEANGVALRTYTRARGGNLAVATAETCVMEDSGHCAANITYGECPEGSSGIVWGANPVGATYSPRCHAFGVEINGANRSGSEAPVVASAQIVNYGNAPLDAGISVDTAASEPEGKPDYGIWLRGPVTTADLPPEHVQHHNVARKTGFLMDKVDSGEAFRTIDGQRYALTTDGQTYIRYDPVADKIVLVKHGVTVMEW